MVFQNNVLGGASNSGTTGYTIDQSIRFNPGDSSYMHKTYSGAGDRTAWTFSTWFKLGLCNGFAAGSGLYYVFFSCDAGTSDANRGIFSINNDSSGSGGMEIQFQGHGTIFLRTNRVFRDPSSWYHVTLVWDSDNAVAQDRCRLYINGVRETSFDASSNPTSGQEIGINTANAHRIGAGYNISGGSVVYYFDGYLAETVFLDGTAANASSFGEFNNSNLWVPKNVSGLTFGTNGFWIDGRDASDLGDDEAGSNDYTTSGLASNDQKPDTPTNNQITFNPLNNQRSGGTPSNGNLDYVGPSTRTLITLTANLPTSGKWCCAFKVQAVSTDAGWQIGVGYADDSDLGDAAGSNEDVSIIRMGPSSSEVFIWDAIAGAEIDPSLAITTSDEFWVAQDMGTGKTYLGIYDASATAMKWIANDGGVDGNPSAGTNETKTNSALAGSDNVAITVASKASNTVYLQKSGDVSGTVPTGYTYFENVMDLIGS